MEMKCSVSTKRSPSASVLIKRHPCMSLMRQLRTALIPEGTMSSVAAFDRVLAAFRSAPKRQAIMHTFRSLMLLRLMKIMRHQETTERRNSRPRAIARDLSLHWRGGRAARARGRAPRRGAGRGAGGGAGSGAGAYMDRRRNGAK